MGFSPADCEALLSLAKGLSYQIGIKYGYCGKEEAAEWQTVQTPDQTAPLNPLYNGRFFHCNILDGSICNFRDVSSIFSLLFYF